MDNLISIIIVNWNGKQWLGKCLNSLIFQTYKKIEIILVDNNSEDDSVEFVKNGYPGVKIVSSQKNLGFAGGNNLGIDSSNGKYILLLNNDTWIDAHFIEKMIDFYRNNKFDIIGPMENGYNNISKSNYITKIDPFGHCVYSKNNIKWKKNFYLGGVCLFFEKSIYRETGGLDADFFMYFEEVDWFWRLNLLKKSFGVVDDLYVHHSGAGSTSGRTKYGSFLWRNQNTLQMLLKNYAWTSLIWVLPVYFMQNVIEILFFLVIGQPKIAFSYPAGWWFNIKNLQSTLKKRKWVQKNRIVKESEIFKKMYFGFGKLKHLIDFYKHKT